MARVFLFILDSFGVGHAADAARYGDQGADTYGHILAASEIGRADRDGLRRGSLQVPVMRSLGLEAAAHVAAAAAPEASGLLAGAFYGAAQEVSAGKDTPSGHWEIAGVPVPFEWGYFPRTVPTFPPELTAAIVREAQLPGILGDRHGSGTDVIAELGEEHLRTGKPICYTSADSVFQIAAHETHFGLERLYGLCRIVRRLVDPLNIGRVIARPFTGETAEAFVRTGNRKDFAIPPPEPTMLDRLTAERRRVISVGKIGDIYAHRGTGDERKASGNEALFDTALEAMREAGSGDLVMANFVDFDMVYGHRRDIPGYAAALEAFDRRLPEALGLLRDGDLLLLTADHGCDPTWPGTDHTRERVPVFGKLSGAAGGAIGLRLGFADIGETIAAHLGIAQGRHGCSFHAAISGRA